MARKFTSLYKKDPIAAELEAGIQGTDVYQGSPYMLSSVPEFEGMKTATTDYNKYADLYNLYLGGGFDAAQDTAQIPGAVDTLVNVDGGAGTGTTTGGTGGVNTPFEQNLINQGAGVQIAPGQPVVAPGEMPVTQQEMDEFNQIPVTQPMTGGVTGDPITVENIAQDQTPYDVPMDMDDPGASIENLIAAEQAKTIPGAPVVGDFDEPTMGTVDVTKSFVDQPDYSAPGTLADPREKMDFVSEADAANPETLLDKLGLSQFNAAEAFVKTAINMAIGKPITFFIDVLKGIIPPMDPRHKALNEFYKTDAIGRVAKGELMAGYNPVSGGIPGISEPTYGLQKAYDERIGNTTDTLQNKYGLTDAEIDSIKAGNITDAIKKKAINATMTETYGKPTVSNLVQQLADLEAAKKAEELATRGARKLVSGDIEDRDLYHDVASQDKVGDVLGATGGEEEWGDVFDIPKPKPELIQEETQDAREKRLAVTVNEIHQKEEEEKARAREAEVRAVEQARKAREAEQRRNPPSSPPPESTGIVPHWLQGDGDSGGGGDYADWGYSPFRKGGRVKYSKGGIVSVMPVTFKRY